MNVKYDYTNRTYYIKEKIHNQTMIMQFEECDRSLDMIYYNVVLGVYNKRKHAQKNEDNAIVTGKYPFETASKAVRAFNLLEQEVIKENKFYNRKIMIMISWVDNRRRDIYYKYLSKRGYKYEVVDGQKFICKIY
jgi:hypothetical protein|nr:MAG TPA: hypothetical protein [Caudoviricetes sp.]